MSSIKPQLRHYWDIQWLRRTLLSAISLLIILLVIPLAAQFTIEHLLEKQGADTADIEDININPFSGTFEIHELAFSKSGSSPAMIKYLYGNLNMLDLLSSRIVFSDIKLLGVQVAVEKNDSDEIYLNGLPLVKKSTTAIEQPEDDPENPEPIEFALIQLELSDIQVDYIEPDFKRKVNISEFLLNNLISWQTENPADLKLEGTINESPVALSAALNLFDVNKRISGSASLKTLGFGPYAKFYRQHIKTMDGEINLDSNFEINIAETFSARVEKKLEINNLKATYRSIDHRSDKIQWDGVTEILSTGQLTMMGNLTITGSQTRDNQQNYELMSFNQLSLVDFKQESKGIRLGAISLNEASLIDLENKSSFVEVGELNLEGLDYLQQPTALTIKTIELKKPAVELIITDEKQLSFLIPLQNTLETLTESSTETQDNVEPVSQSAQQPMKIQIDKLTLLEPGVVNFSDNSVKPNYRTQVTLNKINLDNISSEQTSDFNVAIQQSEYTSIDVEGKGLMFDPTSSLELKAKIKQLDLPPVTPYTSNAMGYGMKSGVVDSDVDLKINNREIDSVVDLKIDSIEVVETNQKTAEQVSSASGMSIDLAVSTLKDKNNVIELKLPVKGNLDQPDFDLSLIINQAMGKAMKSASLAYLKHTLQPFGSLVTLFSLAKAAAEHISLPPILFQTNSLELLDDQQDLLDKILKVLDERPGLKIKACGISALADQDAIHQILLDEEKARQEAAAKGDAKNKKSETKPEDQESVEIVIDEAIIQQKMRNLADQRAAKVKGFFLKQGKLDSSRILNCLSSSKLEQDSKPSVEMQL